MAEVCAGLNTSGCPIARGKLILFSFSVRASIKKVYFPDGASCLFYLYCGIEKNSASISMIENLNTKLYNWNFFFHSYFSFRELMSNTNCESTVHPTLNNDYKQTKSSNAQIPASWSEWTENCHDNFEIFI